MLWKFLAGQEFTAQECSPPPAKIMPIPVLKTRTEKALQGEDKAKNIQKLYKYFKKLSISILRQKRAK
jgi:hypothetical protein